MVADALAALNIFTGCCTKYQLRPVERLGFSGSALWQVVPVEPVLGSEPLLCPKRWPVSHPPPARLPWIHQVLRQAQQHGLDFLPQPQVTHNGQTVCHWAGSTWELMTWLPGQVDSSPQPSPARVAAAFHALARFHLATKELGENRIEPAGAPAIIDRLERWRALLDGRLDRIRRDVLSQRIPEIDDLAEQWIMKHSPLPREMQSRLQTKLRLQLRLQPAIRDLWRDHVLFLGDAVSGFIDLGAMRLDTPLTDVARLMGSFCRDDAALRSAALAAYNAGVPLSQGDRELINLLDASGALLAGWNWLDWLYVEQRQFPSLAAVRGRLSELLSRRRQVRRS